MRPAPLAGYVILAAMLALGAAASRSAPDQRRYALMRLTAEPPETFSALAFNKRGQVLGRLTFPAADPRHHRWHGALWRDGTITDLGTLGGELSDALGINDRGQVVGGSSCADGAYRAFLWENGRMRAITALDGTGVTAAGVNNAGQIVGRTVLPDGYTHSWLWQHERVTDLGTLGGHRTRAAAVNNRGQVAGDSEGRLPLQHAFLWEHGRITDLGTLGGERSEAMAINDRGEVVGWSETADGATHAFLWRNGKMTDLGWDGIPTAINNRGEIVGSGSVNNSPTHALLWRAGTLIDLNGCLASRVTCVLESAHAVNDPGQILAVGVSGRDASRFSYLLTPQTVRAPLGGSKRSWRASPPKPYPAVLDCSTICAGSGDAGVPGGEGVLPPILLLTPPRWGGRCQE